jgi:GNAT superfamily N-acetyltransferase
MKQWRDVPSLDHDYGIGTLSDVPFAVRRADHNDWAALRAIRLEALSETPDAFSSTFEMASNFSNDQWRTMVARWCYFLAERDGVVVGMISGGLNDEHPGTRWLYGMYVTPPARGSGVAAMLVAAIEEWARGERASELFLAVTSSVVRARTFYLKLGFEPTGESHTMTRKPTLELVTMRRSLGDA